MKNVTLICLVLTCFFACKNAPESTTSAKEQSPAETPVKTEVPTGSGSSKDDNDLAAITAAVHNFYKWYETFTNTDYDFLDNTGKSSKLDNSKLNGYHAALLKSGLLSATYIDNDLAYLKKFEAIWKQGGENVTDGPLSGLDFDRIFCGQDWDVVAYKTGAVKVDVVSANEAKASIEGSKLDLVKENGKWLISKITCE
ncbi:MAG: hypothetical protein EAY75_10335 [Bacteroidetes bacterium]|nr:MAG: hypothetical protein EAY75_10335 [Bacteroidota bacterium]